jgi:hypothetical protein
MTDKDKLSKITNRAYDVLKEHNGVYLEKKLYNKLLLDFPDLSRADFKKILNELIEERYFLERGLIRPRIEHGPKKSSKRYNDGTKPEKGVSEQQRIPDKRI